MTENGWPPDTNKYPGVPINRNQCIDMQIPGTNLILPFQRGIPAIILSAFMADLNEYIEPVYNSRGYTDEGSWTPRNDVSTSNHLGGTAFDYNWSDHPFLIKDAGWDGSVLIKGNQVPHVEELLDWYEGMVFWGNNWNSPKDAMHFQMGYGTYQDQDKCWDFIRRKIRDDGFSRYRRDVAHTPKGGLTAKTLAEAMGNSLDLVRYEQLLQPVRTALVQSGCNNLNRIAMWMAQIGHESGGLRYMEEIASGSAYEGRSDLGNTQIGDGVRFKGRGPIQVTGRSNYKQLSAWAFSKGYVPSSDFFVDNPEALADDEYAFLGAIWYWTVARPDINNLCDEEDLETVTRRINGGLNGLDDRRNRWTRCKNMGIDKLSVSLSDIVNTSTILGDIMADDSLWASQSIYRDDNNKWMSVRQTLAACDAMLHEGALVEPSAIRGEQWAIAKVIRLARRQGPGAKLSSDTSKEDTWAIEHAKAVLQEIKRVNPTALQTFLDNEQKGLI